MTWAETSSPADLDLPPLTPPCADEPSAPAHADTFARSGNLAAEIGSWTEPPVTMADGAGLAAMGERAQALGYLWVELAPPGPEYRGRLGLYIEEGLEARLEQLGAPPAGIHASTSLDASLSDQLYRARFVERRGLALGIPSLEGIANLGRTLDADDSSVLRWWIAATADRPVRLVVSTQNQFLRVYPSPVLFDSLLELVAEPVSPRAPSVALAESAGAMELSDLPPAVIEAEPTVTAPFQPESALAASAEMEPASPEPPTALLAAEDVPLPSEPQFDEPTTDVLGTRVAPLFDVALPGLDRALGLLGDEPLAATEELAAAEEAAPADVAAADFAPEGVAAADVAAAEPDAFADDVLAEELALERARREAVTLVPPPDEPSLAQDLLASEQVTPHVAPVAATRPWRAAGQAADAPAPVTPRMTLGEPPAIDAEEFLRVLEADSAPPPAVDVAAAVDAAPVAAPVSAPAADAPASAAAAPAEDPIPTPLPEKKLRRPFLRMAADEPLAVSDADAAAAVCADESPAVQAAPTAPESAATELAEAASAPRDERPQATTPHVAPIDPSDPFDQLAQKEWRTWRDALAQASGPRPLAAIERMFVTDYTRLAEATRRGIADDTARAALAEWQGSFQKSYAETFDALRVRGKRPTMVLDLPDIAQRLGRLQGARRVQLLLIDGLRFDLGLMVQERLRARVDAALTERLLLWSALPSTTTVQLELLGKGPEGLLERFGSEEAPTLVARGRAARTPRRIRTGRVEVNKIDVVEDALRTLGRPVVERFDAIAADTADAIAEHMAAQPPRTLVVVFGDHGFRLDAARAGTTEEVRQGGSTPEEVLVPAFAWLTGAVH